MAVYHLDCAQLKEAAPSLRAGDRVLLSGTAYTARDAAHKRIAQALEAVYLCAVGGAGALAAKCIDSCDVIAYEDLGCESVKKLHFKEFPLTVAIDCTGGNLFERS